MAALYHLPHVWGTRSDLLAHRQVEGRSRHKLSYGDLWNEDVKGHVQGRPHSLLLGIGLWLDATGKLPSNRMLDAFKDPDTFKKIYDQILPFAIEHKPWIKQFWDLADNTKSGLIENDVWIGQTWDGPASLKKDGKPVNYQAPKEGAITWVDGLSLLKAAKNVDQIYEFIDFLHTPEIARRSPKVRATTRSSPGADACSRRSQEELPGSLSWRFA